MKASKNNHFTQFQDFIIGKEHPCLMAQTVFKLNQISFKEYKDFGTSTNVHQILEDLDDFIGSYDFHSNEFNSFIAAFPEETIKGEMEFEKKLWQQLQYLHEHDGKKWDPKVDRKPENKNFSFSLRGHAFYVIGMHPESSRKARQSPFPTMVFNLHWQFEKMREMNIYNQTKKRIRKRDKDLQGNINPMLADFGKKSEARQYSGRKVGKDWKCPFHHS